ncbi:MAG: hypothetical protein AAGP08_01655 [Pseudomonadota bacterium]
MNTETDIRRDSFIADTAADFVLQVFEMSPGEARIIPGEDAVMVAALTDVLPPDLADPQIGDADQALEQRARQSIASDLLSAFAIAVQNDLGISIDQTALQAVHVNIP